MSGTTIVKCRCERTPACEFQDRRYGKGRRVANINAKGEGHCTCCGTIHRLPESKGERKKSANSGGKGGAKWFIAIPPPGGWPGGLPENNGYRKIT